MKDQAFCEVAAQVIPVLFIALLIEVRLFGNASKERPGIEMGLLAVILLAAAAEFTAVSALSEERRLNDLEASVVSGAIGLLFLPIIVRAGRPHAEAIGQALPWTRWINAIMPFVIAAVIVAAVIFDISLSAIFIGSAAAFFVIASGVAAFESESRQSKQREQKKSGARDP